MNKTLVKTISLLWISSLAGAGFAFITQIVLAHYLTPISFGDFVTAFATTTLFVPLAGFGISQFWLKVFGQEGKMAIRWLPSSFKFILLSTTAVFILLIFWALVGPHNIFMKNLLLAFSFYVWGQVSIELISSKLQLEERYMHLALWQLLPHFIRLVLIIGLFFLMNDLFNAEMVAKIYAVVAIIFTLLGGIQLSNMTKGHFALKGHTLTTKITHITNPTLYEIITQTWPFGLASLFHLIYFQSDIILVKYLSGSEVAGYYHVAFTIIVAIYIFPSVIYQKFLLPKIHRWANHDRERFYKTYRQGNFIMFVIGITAMILVWLLSSWLIPILFGNNYIDAVVILNILALSIPIIFVASSVGATLVTQEHMRKKVKYMGLIAGINIILNIILIPTYGAIGASIATVISNLMLLIIFYYASEKIVFRGIIKVKDIK